MTELFLIIIVCILLFGAGNVINMIGPISVLMFLAFLAVGALVLIGRLLGKGISLGTIIAGGWIIFWCVAIAYSYPSYYKTQQDFFSAFGIGLLGIVLIKSVELLIQYSNKRKKEKTKEVKK